MLDQAWSMHIQSCKLLAACRASPARARHPWAAPGAPASLPAVCGGMPRVPMALVGGMDRSAGRACELLIL